MASAPAEQILAWLRDATRPLSGEDIAARLGMSRAAVFKHVEALRARGYGIEAQQALGYRLVATPDRLDAAEVVPRLTGTWRRIDWHAALDSTQRRATELARDGAEEGTTVVAEAQTAGRGRLGRRWHSPPGRNVYASVILRPALPPSEVPQLALVAGLATARAVAAATGLDARVKWPNDILLDGRKVAGILTEMEAELERVRFVIVGIGVNVNAPADAFPPDLRALATSLAIAAGRPVDRVGFMARLLADLEAGYRVFLASGFAGLRGEWEAQAALTGRHVVVRAGDGAIEGEVLGVDDDGALRLASADGVRRVVAGDVTLRDDAGR